MDKAALRGTKTSHQRLTGDNSPTGYLSWDHVLRYIFRDFVALTLTGVQHSKDSIQSAFPGKGQVVNI